MPGESKKDKKQQEDDKPVIHSGVYIFPNGDKYEGEFIHGSDGSVERSGQGVHTTTDGTTYSGQWESDKMNGQGKLTNPSGAVYEGCFTNNQFHGRGKYTWPNCSFYEGDFQENRMEGDGQFTDTEGQVWVGTFRYKAAPGLKFKLNLD
ncbi:MORN repeat-containing protein 2-like [Argopecten irradians]|uniref:MORN repeat-containing protein 2-like n=1 Tax=Argopecten irradians TaxID=31199 RepID=UPI003723FC86